ncbi:uncharacterized protein TRIADDRAFT_54339 [Trichoplax adhaerens]|uniref:SP-RING-type domain-containing protein n=1 Tax=Trichoplax adhaerens TaxID=10228 RepID=B3RRR7_TRIAD|nr:hypothetical protein TRIADDRAFT_54339 [Trichoplax adhaerens]EDV26398.1 hypothetical protein TRIADDRAFT_54339 [Trichoplax adhaerens]|eukprot:XP_002110394.1 hypothetical protein TRIADDRAFT_54339 [Trichoplax adhaerens]
MLNNFRVPELQQLLTSFNSRKTGRKPMLISRALELLETCDSRNVKIKIREIYNLRNHYHHQASNHVVIHNHNHVVPSYSNQSNNNNTNFHVVNNNSRNQIGWYIGDLNNSTSKGHREFHFALNTASKLDFKSLKITPFHEPLESISNTFLLDIKYKGRYYEKEITFTLSSSQIEMLNKTRHHINKPENESLHHLFLRLGTVDSNGLFADYYPHALCVKANGSSCPIPNIAPSASNNSKSGTAKKSKKPIDITQYINITPNYTNRVKVSCTPLTVEKYYGSIILVRQSTPGLLLQKILDKDDASQEQTISLVKEKLKQNSDVIVTTKLNMSLQCPLMKNLMTYPCRSSSCKHLQCFDAMSFLRMNESYCRKIIESIPANVLEISFNEDGSWTAENEDEKSSNVIKDTVEIAHVVKDKPKEHNKSVEVIDLTAGSDSEDDNYVPFDDLFTDFQGDTPEPKRLKSDSQPEKRERQEIPNHSAAITTVFPDYHLYAVPGHSQRSNNYLPNAMPNNLLPHLPITSSLAPEMNNYVCGTYDTVDSEFANTMYPDEQEFIRNCLGNLASIITPSSNPPSSNRPSKDV